MKKKEIKKLYYSIRDVAEMAGVEPHVLRFWEKEFSILRPKRGRSGNRSYRERDIRVVLAIKRLLYDEKYTIKGAVERLQEDRSILDEEISLYAPPAPEDGEAPEQTGKEAVLADLREMLLDLKKMVEGNLPA